MSDATLPPADAFVVEVGLRQAWLVVTFAEPAGTVETRLSLDTDDLEDGLLLLCRLLNLALTAATKLDGGGLVLAFDGGARFEVDAQPARATTHDTWWTSRVG